jgi:hypothetical protein
MFWAALMEDGKQVGEYDGYVPSIMPGDNDGDYVMMDIDLATGQITNWKKPTEAEIKAFKKKLTTK